MKFNVGKYSYVWDNFIKNQKHITTHHHGDQDWITEQIRTVSYWPENWCISYKWQQCWKSFDPNAKIIIFHGNPKPPEAITGYRHYPPSPWIRNFWR